MRKQNNNFNKSLKEVMGMLITNLPKIIDSIANLKKVTKPGLIGLLIINLPEVLNGIAEIILAIKS